MGRVRFRSTVLGQVRLMNTGSGTGAGQMNTGSGTGALRNTGCWGTEEKIRHELSDA